MVLLHSRHLVGQSYHALTIAYFVLCFYTKFVTKLSNARLKIKLIKLSINLLNVGTWNTKLKSNISQKH